MSLRAEMVPIGRRAFLHQRWPYTSREVVEKILREVETSGEIPAGVARKWD